MPKAKREPMANISEVAEYLGVAVQTLYNMRARSEGPRSTKVGGRVRYRWSDVDAYLDARSTGDAA